MSDTIRIIKHEWSQIAKEPKFLIPFLLIPLIMIGVQVFALFFQPTVQLEEQYLLSRSLLIMLAILVSGLTVPLCADSFAGEKERHTLETLLSLPISLRTLFRAKVLAVYPFPVIVAWFGQGLILLALFLRGILSVDFGSDAIKAFLLTPVIGLSLCAMSTLISLRADSVRAAAQVAGIFMLLFFFLLIGTSPWIFLSWTYWSALLIFLLAISGLCFYLSRRIFLHLR